MKPVLFDFGSLGPIPLRVYGYGLMMVLGFLTAIVLANRRVRRGGEDPEALTHCGILALIGGVVGARIAYVIQHHETFTGSDSPIVALINVTSGGLIYYGGVILATVLVLLYLWRRRLPVRRYLDILAAALMVGLAFGRAGCLLNGCCYGGPCHKDWPLGMRFPMYSRPLVKLSDTPGPLSDSTQSPSPVYALQFHSRQVEPDDRLVAGEKRIRSPRDLHGRLTRDQLTVMFGEKADAQKLFSALAGGDGRVTEAEWQAGLRRGDGFLRGSEQWSEAAAFDADQDGQLSFDEAWQYLQVRRSELKRRFGGAESAPAADAWAPGGAQWKHADAHLREDLFALAEAHWSDKVQPAQVFGIINALLIAFLLSMFYRVRKREGQVFALLLVLYPITRFVLEAIRVDNEHNLLAFEFTHNQITSMVMFTCGVLLLLWLRRLPASAGPTWAQRLAAAQAEARPRSEKSARKPRKR